MSQPVPDTARYCHCCLEAKATHGWVRDGKLVWWDEAVYWRHFCDDCTVDLTAESIERISKHQLSLRLLADKELDENERLAVEDLKSELYHHDYRGLSTDPWILRLLSILRWAHASSGDYEFDDVYEQVTDDPSDLVRMTGADLVTLLNLLWQRVRYSHAPESDPEQA